LLLNSLSRNQDRLTVILANAAFSVGLSCISVRAIAQTASCPPPANLVRAEMRSAVTQDPTSKMYHYSYTLINASSSAQDIDGVTVEFSPPSVTSIASPSGWAGDLMRGENAVMWAAIQAGEPPPGTPDDGSIPPSLVQVKPGGSLAGFSFVSANPPGPVTFYATGYVAIPPVADEETAEGVTQNCPNVAGGVSDTGLIGTTQGPAPAGTSTKLPLISSVESPVLVGDGLTISGLGFSKGW